VPIEHARQARAGRVHGQAQGGGVDDQLGDGGAEMDRAAEARAVGARARGCRVREAHGMRGHRSPDQLARAQVNRGEQTLRARRQIVRARPHHMRAAAARLDAHGRVVADEAVEANQAGEGVGEGVARPDRVVECLERSQVETSGDMQAEGGSRERAAARAQSC
jgi:hypothetical protein